MSTRGIAALIEERVENVINRDKRSIEYDIVNNPNGELLEAARSLINGNENEWPKSWDMSTFEKLHEKSEEDQLIIVAGFLISEYDRRKELKAREVANTVGKSFDEQQAESNIAPEVQEVIDEEGINFGVTEVKGDNEVPEIKEDEPEDDTRTEKE